MNDNLPETYTAVAQFAQSWGLLYFFLAFCAIVAFVMWPSRRKRYEDAGKIPLRED